MMPESGRLRRVTYGMLHSTQMVAQGRYDEALAQATREIEAAPDEPEALFNRAQALVGLQRHEEGLADYARVLVADSERQQPGSRGGRRRVVRCPARLAVQQQADLPQALATIARYRSMLPEGRHVDDVQKWTDHFNGVQVVWRRNSLQP